MKNTTTEVRRYLRDLMAIKGDKTTVRDVCAIADIHSVPLSDVCELLPEALARANTRRGRIRESIEASE